MPLYRLPPGTRFVVRDAQELRGVLVSVSEGRAIVRFDKPPEHVAYTTSDGRWVEFYRPARTSEVTRCLDVIPA